MLIILACLIMPAVLSFYNFIGLFRKYKNRTLQYIMWILTPVLGTAETVLFMGFMDVQLNTIWSEQLYNSQLHQPVWTGSCLTLGLVCFSGILAASRPKISRDSLSPAMESSLAAAVFRAFISGSGRSAICCR